MASTSKDKSVRNTKKYEFVTSDSNMNIELIKKEFNEKLLAHFLSKNNPRKFSQFSNLISRQCLETLIKTVRKEELKSSQFNNYNSVYQDKYKIVATSNEKERLFFKHDGVKFKVIVPWEEIFDIYWQAHLTHKHLKDKDLKIFLQNEYIVNNFAIKTISDVCYTCSGARKPYYRCTLDLISMGGRTDFAFSHIMIYQDLCTGFMHLRPLSVDNRDSEICVELLRIFMDFGPPQVVFISHDIFLTALEQFEHLTKFALSKPIEISQVKPNIERLTNLRHKISIWMEKNNFQNWGIALYAIQLYLNNESQPEKKSPYESVFKKIRTCDVGDLDEVEFENFQSSNSLRVDTGVTAASPTDFVATSYCAEQARPDSLSSVEEPKTEETYAGTETEFSAASDDEVVQFEAEDPLAMDSSSSS